MREGVVRLCVGGKLFATYTDTLLKARGMKQTFAKRRLLLTPQARFFECLLSGRFKREEEIFIDRSPELFKHVLQFLRTGIAPPQDYIVAHKAELLEDFRIP